MTTLLVTGGAGFIGGNFVLDAVARGDHVVNLDLLTYAGNLDTLGTMRNHPRHHFVQGDIADTELVRALFQEYRPAAVINFAAESHVDRSIDGPDAFIQTNVVGTLGLLKETLDYWRTLPDTGSRDFRFLHVSTDEVYGSLGDQGQFTETTPYQPNSPYSASKAASDHLVRAYHHTYGLPVLTTNCSNNYGPFQFPEKLIPLVIHKALNGEAIPIYGDGLNVRDWLYVEDHCSAIRSVLAGGSPGEVYNIGGDEERTNLEVVTEICDVLDQRRPRNQPRKQLITYVDDRPGHDRRYAIDASKIKRELAWRAEVDFAGGIRRTVDWYLEHPQWVARVLDGSYQGQRLGTDTGSAASDVS